jgi:mitochondrial import inner membrane translocase subunit TIM44
LSTSIKENPRLRAAAEELKKTGVKVGDAVSEALKTMEESDLMRTVRSYFLFSITSLLTLSAQITRATSAVSSTIEKTTEPIRNTTAYKVFSETIIDALDDSGTAKHAGFEDKELRRRRRQLRLAKAGQEGRMSKSSRVTANPECVSLRSFKIPSSSPRSHG